jgi:mono/diheme cytochrome c family protein
MGSGSLAEQRARRATRRVAISFALGVCALVGCASPTQDEDRSETAARGDKRARKPEQPALCGRDRADAVRDVFCAPKPPSIRSLEDLQAALLLQPHAPQTDEDVPLTPLGVPQGDRAVAVLGHSTALSGHLVSPINPRLIIMGDGSLMAYQRGVQKVEVITTARDTPGIDQNFYLFQFEQACNRHDDGCSPGDLYTPRVERDWLSVRIEDDEDLKNTPNDCRQCHQRARELPTRLMRELNNPWTHFFEPKLEGAERVVPGVRGRDLMRDYLRAKGDERYGNFALESLLAIAPFLLENMVGAKQPVLFDAPGIEKERFPYDQVTRRYTQEPNASPTWEASYDAFKRGEQLALPYFETRVSDVDKQAQLSDAYASYRVGELDAAELPELGEIFPDDPYVRARIGLQTEPEAEAPELLIQACGSCHNDVLDQSISRARFNVDLWRLEPSEIELAIQRIELPRTDPAVMPPAEARQLDEGGRERLLEYLRNDPLSLAPDPRLERAAELGMAGGADRRVIPRR